MLAQDEEDRENWRDSCIGLSNREAVARDHTSAVATPSPRGTTSDAETASLTTECASLAANSLATVDLLCLSSPSADGLIEALLSVASAGGGSSFCLTSVI